MIKNMTTGVNFYTLKDKNKMKTFILKEFNVGTRIALIK